MTPEAKNLLFALFFLGLLLIALLWWLGHPGPFGLGPGAMG